MTKLRIIAIVLSALAGLTLSATIATDAFACPAGHVRCGPGCCG